jgi:hypothetical protein
MLWLMRFSELFRIRIVRYSFFEAQKGKTSLDSHFATFKFVLKSWMKQGNYILKSNNIVNGTADHLKGTHVYEINLDRANEPTSANTWNGITRFGSFTYIYDGSEFIAIDVREQTNNFKAERFTKQQLFKLWSKYLMSKSISNGVTSNFKIENHENVETRLLKKPKKEKRECKENLESNADCDADGCPNCGRKFLRASWLEKHVETCKSTKDKERKRKTAEEVRQSLPVREALGSAAKLRKLVVHDGPSGP